MIISSEERRKILSAVRHASLEMVKRGAHVHGFGVGTTDRTVNGSPCLVLHVLPEAGKKDSELDVTLFTVRDVIVRPEIRNRARLAAGKNY